MKKFKKIKLDYYNKELFDSINIDTTTNYEYIGSIRNIKEIDIIKYLETIGKNKKDNIKKVFKYIIKTIKIMSYKYGCYNIRLNIITDIIDNKLLFSIRFNTK